MRNSWYATAMVYKQLRQAENYIMVRKKGMSSKLGNLEIEKVLVIYSFTYKTLKIAQHFDTL